jgi:hypothetical protein
MNRREVLVLVSGLIVGLLFGIFLGSRGVAGNLLAGSASAPVSPPTYYLVDLPTAAQWLEANRGESDADVSETINAIVELTSAPDFRQNFVEASESIDTLLAQAQTALYGLDANVPAPTAPALAEFPQVCLGLDDDPYRSTGPAFYLYFQVAPEQRERIPDEWVSFQQTQPKHNDLYWQLIGCYPAPDAQS